MNFRGNLALFDKARDNILAWMAVNKDWEDRCTAENMERHKAAVDQSDVRLEALATQPRLQLLLLLRA